MEFKGTKGVFELVGNEIHCDGVLIGYATNRFFQAGEDALKTKYNAKLFSKSLDLLELLGEFVSMSDELSCPDYLIESFANLYANSFNTIQEATTI